jgi:hypothetical protein
VAEAGGCEEGGNAIEHILILRRALWVRAPAGW